jgi:hypothetical protein
MFMVKLPKVPFALDRLYCIATASILAAMIGHDCCCTAANSFYRSQKGHAIFPELNVATPDIHMGAA